MILDTNSEMLHFINKIRKEENRNLMGVTADGKLRYGENGYWDTFLAYVNGHWYGAKDGRTGTSDLISEKGKFLFAISETKFWMLRNDNCAEYSSSTKDLSEDALAFLLAEQTYGLCLYVIDGSKCRKPLFSFVETDLFGNCLGAQLIIALVRQYDTESADQMEKFWFAKDKDIQTKGNEIESSNDDSPPWD